MSETKTAGPETKPYKLRQGARHWHDNAPVKPGATVQLTEAQATAFADKFEPVGKAELPQQGEGDGIEKTKQLDPKAAAAAAVAAGKATVPTSHTPQDIGAKSNTLPDSNVGNVVPRSGPAPLPTLGADGEAKGLPPVRDSREAALVGGSVTPQTPEQKEQTAADKAAADKAAADKAAKDKAAAAEKAAGEGKQ